MQRSTLAKRAGPLLLLLCATLCCYLYGLGRTPLVGADEPRYAQVAREMYERGDLVTPTLGGHTWFEKPALPYWTAEASYKLFGVSEFAARLGAAGAGLLTILLSAWVAGRVERAAGAELQGFGLAAPLAVASCGGLLVFARGLNFDIFITCATTGALACFLGAELVRDVRARRWLLAGCYVGVGVGLLAKGLVGIVIPAGVVALYHLLRRRWPANLRTLLWGVPLAAAVAALWYGPVYARHGWTFVDEFFIQHHFARYVSNKYHHPQPFYYYLPVMALLALPWTAFLVAALWHARRWHWRGDRVIDKLRVCAFAWLVLPVAFFSLSGSKLPGYVLPALPGALLLVGEQLARYGRGAGGRGAMRATGALSVLFAAGGLGYALSMKEIGPGWAALALVPAAVVGVVALLRPVRGLAWGVGGAAALTVVLLVAGAAAPLLHTLSVRDLLRTATTRGYGAAPVYQLHVVERTAEFYAAGRLAYDPQGAPVKLEGAGEVYHVAQAAGRPVLVLVPVQYVTQLTNTPLLTSELIADNGETALCVVRARPQT